MNETEFFEALEGNFGFDRVDDKRDQCRRLADKWLVFGKQKDAAIARCLLCKPALVTLSRIGQKAYLATSHASWRAQRLATIGSTAGTSAGVAGQICITIAYRRLNT